MTTVLCIIGGLILGLIAAFINSRISRKGINADTTGGVMIVNIARIIIDIIALAIGYLVCRYTELPMVPTLIAIAVGLSAGSMLFLYLLSKHIGEK